MWRKSLRLLAAALTVLIVLCPATASAQTSDPFAEWRFSPDYRFIEIGGNLYENPWLLIKQSPEQYLFVNPWANGLVDPQKRAELNVRTPNEIAFLVNDLGPQALQLLGMQFPNYEVILIGGRPWQEHPFGQAYLSMIPAEYRKIASDPSLRGYMAEVIQGELTESDARTAPRDGVTVVGVKYAFYHSASEVPLEGDALAPEALEEVTIPYRDFIAQIGGEWPSAWGSSSPPTKQVEVVLYLGRADMTVYENRGTPEERAEVRWLDQPAVAPEGYTLIPARAVFEALGATVEWLPDTRQVVVETPDKQIKLTIGSNMALVTTKGLNSVAEHVAMQVSAQILNNRTVIPLRFVAEALGYEVEWYAPDRRITVRATVLSE